MAFYETVILTIPEYTQAQVDALVDSCKETLKKLGGKIAKTENWGLRSLAYRIQKNRKAHYVLLQLDCPAAALAELERTLRFNEDVIRYLSIKIDAIEKDNSVMLRKREYDDNNEYAGPTGGRESNKRSKGHYDAGRGN